MKTKIAFIVLTLIAFAATAADKIQFNLLSGVNLRDGQPLRGTLWQGAGVQYALTKSIALTAEAGLTDLTGRGIDQVGGHFKGYLPFFKTGLLGYGELGYQRHFAGQVDYMSTGAGIEVRGKKATLGVGARVLEDFRTGAKVQPVAYVGMRF